MGLRYGGLLKYPRIFYEVIYDHGVATEATHRCWLVAPGDGSYGHLDAKTFEYKVDVSVMPYEERYMEENCSRERIEVVGAMVQMYELTDHDKKLRTHLSLRGTDVERLLRISPDRAR